MTIQIVISKEGHWTCTCNYNRKCFKTQTFSCYGYRVQVPLIRSEPDYEVLKYLPLLANRY